MTFEAFFTYVDREKVVLDTSLFSFAGLSFEFRLAFRCFSEDVQVPWGPVGDPTTLYPTNLTYSEGLSE